MSALTQRLHNFADHDECPPTLRAILREAAAEIEDLQEQLRKVREAIARAMERDRL